MSPFALRLARHAAEMIEALSPSWAETVRTHTLARWAEQINDMAEEAGWTLSTATSVMDDRILTAACEGGWA